MTMRSSVVGVVAALLWTASAGAEEPQRWFVDIYGGVAKTQESDVEGWNFNDAKATVGGRGGFWFTRHWALTFRTWYFQTDADQELRSPSDLHLLGFSLEVLGRWQFHERVGLYGSLGPMVAATRLDMQNTSGHDEVDRTVSPGVSGAVGVEVRLLKHLGAFAEAQSSLTYPSFEFSTQDLSPRVWNIYGLGGVRILF
jgi:hypothetical protein